MTTLAPATCGFLPMHLYEGAELQRSLDICDAINAFAMEAMGLGKADPKKVADLSLREMLDALETVERWNSRPHTSGIGYSVAMVPAERLIAAVYTLVHFFNRSANGDKDDDHMPVRFTQRRWGTDYVHFLLIGDREAAEFEADEDEEQAA